MGKNFLLALQKLEGAVVDEINPFSTVIQTPSPSTNFTYGNSWGLPLGFTQVFFGPPKGGKTVLANGMIGQVHKDFDDGWTVKFDTELRERGQMTPQQAALWGIDRKRHVTYSVNSPDMVFDRIEKDLAALCQEGMPLKLVVVDSITGIQGRRAMNQDTIMTQQIGDLALTLQEGFKRILPVQRKYNFAVLLTAHVRAQMDPVEVMRGNKFKMAAALGVQHYAEYFTFVEPWLGVKGRETLLGEKLEDESVSDMREKNGAERTGHKIRVTMTDSSLGPKGRVGIFTLDYNKGIINTEEEIFLLGVNRNVLDSSKQGYYGFADKQWKGKAAMLQAIKEDPDLYRAVLGEIKDRDLAGKFGEIDGLKDLAEV